MNLNQQVSDYIAKASEAQIQIMEALRSLIHLSVPGTSEAVKWGFPVFKKTKDFAYFRFSKQHITLGFYNVDKINDPENLLEGEGNTLKHIKIRKMEDIRAEVLQDWLVSIAV
jgi:hypothetical protein